MKEPENIPGEPHGDPTMHVKGYDVYAFDSDDSEVVPDVYVAKYAETEADPYLRLWIAHGVGPFLRYDGMAQHEYGPEEPGDPADCCSWDGESDPPSDVSTILARVSDAPVVGPRQGGE